ncbi:MAG TPA: creatininase family protein [Spirochaetia bacterium]|nr:creatininase family protein [Spirochaetia bacterium]
MVVSCTVTEKIDYEELLPHELAQRLGHRPVGYLPLGTLEWHGVQNALGADFIQARGIFRRAAQRFGGVVLPPLWVGPDRIACQESGPDLIGMDYADTTTPNRQLPGSCYWIPKGLFLSLVEGVLAQARRAGFRCIVADGHGPSRNAWAEMVPTWEKQFGLLLVSTVRDFADRWPTQQDHAGRNETSIMLAVEPRLVELSLLPKSRSEWPQGVAGEDPRDATADHGEELIEKALGLLGGRLEQLGI